MITGVETPAKSWKCCLKHTKEQTAIMAFLNRLVNSKDEQKKYIQGNTILTDINALNEMCKYTLLFKMDKKSSRIIPLLIHPKPCGSNPCKYCSKY